MTHDSFSAFCGFGFQSAGECVVKRPRLVRKFSETEHLFVCYGSQPFEKSRSLRRVRQKEPFS